MKKFSRPTVIQGIFCNGLLTLIHMHPKQYVLVSLRILVVLIPVGTSITYYTFSTISFPVMAQPGCGPSWRSSGHHDWQTDLNWDLAPVEMYRLPVTRSLHSLISFARVT